MRISSVYHSIPIPKCSSVQFSGEKRISASGNTAAASELAGASGTEWLLNRTVHNFYEGFSRPGLYCCEPRVAVRVQAGSFLDRTSEVHRPSRRQGVTLIGVSEQA